MADEHLTRPPHRQGRIPTHGASKRGKWTPEYRAWTQMKVRCFNTSRKDYGRYGGRGIKICDRWVNSFPAFLEDMGPRPSPRHQLDRIDNDGNYESGNCRWATRSQQCRNRRNNTLITHNGRTMSLQAWADEYGLHRGTLTKRIESNWPMEKALTAPVRRW